MTKVLHRLENGLDAPTAAPCEKVQPLTTAIQQGAESARKLQHLYRAMGWLGEALG